MFNAINNTPGIEKIDLSSVKSCFSGSAPLTEDVQMKFESMTGAKIVEGFGLTETSPVLTCNPLLGQRKIGHIGIPMPNTEVRIVDPEDGRRELPFGQEGELIARGPQIMKGYWQRPEATAEMIQDGWLYTGDLAVMDEDGYLRIVGRKKDMIIARGLQTSTRTRSTVCCRRIRRCSNRARSASPMRSAARRSRPTWCCSRARS